MVVVNRDMGLNILSGDLSVWGIKFAEILNVLHPPLLLRENSVMIS